MTEDEWQMSADPEAMLESFILTLRKQRLFYCGCCRRVEHLLQKPEWQALIEANERFADGNLLLEKLNKMVRRARRRATYLSPKMGDREAEGYAENAIYELCRGNGPELLEAAAKAIVLPTAAGRPAPRPVRPGARSLDHTRNARDFQLWFDLVSPPERKAQADLVREVFGNPFCPTSVDPAWITSTVVALARQAYDSRDFALMPILADALQDAGCEDDSVLGHCRGNSLHVRGCWVVDLILGKS